MLSVSNFTVYWVFIDCLEIQTTVFGQEDCYLQFFPIHLLLAQLFFQQKKKTKQNKTTKKDKEIFLENAAWSEISPEKGKTSRRHNKTWTMCTMFILEDV